MSFLVGQIPIRCGEQMPEKQGWRHSYDEAEIRFMLCLIDKCVHFMIDKRVKQREESSN